MTDLETMSESSSQTTRTYVLDTGQLIAEGPTSEVMASPRVREAYLGAGV